MTARILPFAALLLALALSSATARSLTTTVSDPATRANAPAAATAGEPKSPASACDNTKSPEAAVTSGTKFKASLSGLKNVKPNTTGVLMPMPGDSRGNYSLTVDEGGKKASWTLELCDVPSYLESHLHIGSKTADFPPPLIPLEPYKKPANPFAPPELLPHLCPPVEIKGCSYTAKGSFSDADITPLLGREPQGDKEVPSVRNWSEFLRALKDGKIYINVHSKAMPAGLIRGNLESAE